ncbi:hypothetical protein [Thermoactinomyces sp. DSM 45892]|uniref:hypothetical protein n=1 Tax=Thermoactinomyces sp. DSM 45892 TaxID=1882753 RepID=UPI00089621FD|nr:hypothetical protein [Thermoactinomyces sp. DSM 45892]SDY17407.1 hypothetical protein SAMN05444416_102206 [Thermoactinomyces sp. DSM 45892]
MEEQLKELTMMVRAIYDQQLVMNAKIDGLDKRVGNIEDRLDRIENRMDKLEVRMDGLEQRMDKLEVRMDGLEQGMDKLEVRMDGLEQGMDKLEVRMDQVDYIAENLTQGTHNLEVKVDRAVGLLDQKVTHIEQEGTDTQERLKYIRTVLIRHDEEILALGLKRSV